MSLTLRSTKGSALTYAEADANFAGLAAGSLVSYNLITASLDGSGNVLGTVANGKTLPAMTCEGFGASSSASASTNTSAIQNALNRTGLISLMTPGTYTTLDTFTIPADTLLITGPGVNLQVSGGGVVTTLIRARSTGLAIDSAGNLTGLAGPGGVVIPLWFAGGTWNGVTDDTTALQATLTAAGAYATTNNSAVIVQAPYGTAMISSQLTVPNRVILRGAGKRATNIKATSGFTVSTPLIQLGNTTGLAFDTRLENLTVDCNSVTGSTAVIANKMQEGAGLSHCVLTRCATTGFNVAADNNANFYLDDLEIYPLTGASYGIYTKNNGGKFQMRDLTIVGGSAANLLAAIFVDTAGQGMIHGLHVGNCAKGLYTDGNNCAVFADNLDAEAGTTTLLHIATGNRVVAANLIKSSATNTIVDAVVSITRTDGFIPFYVGAQGLYTGGVVLTPKAIGSSANAIAVNASTGNYQPCNTLTENTTVGSPSSPTSGQRLTIRFVQDGTGGRTVAWNAIFHGVTLAASGTLNQRAIITFFYDGTVWIQESTSGWVA